VYRIPRIDNSIAVVK